MTDNARTVDIVVYVTTNGGSNLKPYINEDKEIVFLPQDDTSVVKSFVRATEGVAKKEDEIELKLSANMVSNDDNFDWFGDIDEIGQFYITPDSEEAYFDSFTEGDSINLVGEETEEDNTNQPLNEANQVNVAKEAFTQMFGDVEKQLDELMDKWEDLKKKLEEQQKAEQFTTVTESVKLEESVSGKEALEILRIAKEIGIETGDDLIKFYQEHPSFDEHKLETIKEYRAELGDDFSLEKEPATV